jgi:alpha-maltose-1-phosphate synthase
MSKLRILYVAPFDLRHSAGHASHVVATVRQMTRKGHDVTLLATGCPEDVAEIIRFVEIPIINRRSVRAVSFGIAAAIFLLRDFVSGRPQVVYSRYFTSVVLSTILSRLCFVPVMLEVNADLSNERRVSNRGYVAAKVERIESWVAFRCSSAVVAVTDAIAASITVIAPRRASRIHVVENGVDTSIYIPRDQIECATRLSLNSNMNRVVFAGAFQLWQGLLDLVDAMSLLSQKRKNVELLLVGDGPMRIEIEAKIVKLGLREHVHITGYVSEEDVANYICASDVCVAPYNIDAASENESRKCSYGARLRGSPLKIYAYLACGRPVVASHFREAGAYIESLGVGVAVAPEEPELLANALDRILSNPNEATRMGIRGREIAADRHDWSAVVDSYLEIATNLTENNQE